MICYCMQWYSETYDETWTDTSVVEVDGIDVDDNATLRLISRVVKSEDCGMQPCIGVGGIVLQQLDI